MRDERMKRRCKQIGAVSELPEEIIWEILVRVSSATSLWEFRCVCKSWCSLISSTTFIQSHLKNSLITSNFILIESSLLKPTIKIRPLYPLFPDYDGLIELDCPVFTNYHQPQIHLVSTCNGLCLLLVNKRDLYLWNPFIKKVRKLADFAHHQDHDNIPIVIQCSAFGFDESTGDYNVVAFINIMGPKNITKLYSFKSDSWRRFAEFDCHMAHDSGKFLNGKVYWLTTWRGGSNGFRIASLDLTSEVETTIEVPRYLFLYDHRYLRVRPEVPRYLCLYDHRYLRVRPLLGVHGGCLSVLCQFITHWKLWVLKESSWVMVATFTYPKFNPPITRVLCVAEGGEILISKKYAITVYDPKIDSYRHPRFTYSFYSADICIQSLISPFPDGMVKKKSQSMNNSMKETDDEKVKLDLEDGGP